MKHIEKIVIGMIAVLIVLIVIIATDFWLLWLPLAHSSEYPQKVAALFMALTALVTLLVVYATFNATRQSNLRELTRRKDEIEKENRDRKERLLNEIIEWAQDIRKSSSESIDPNEIIFDTPIEQMATQHGFYNLRLRYQDISVKSEYMEGIAKKVFGNELLSATEIVTQKLSEIVDILKDCLTNRRASQKEKNEEVETYKKSLDSYAEDLIREAVKIKTRDIG